MPKIRDGGEVFVNYMLMPLTAEETKAGGECLGARYAIEHKDRWINVNDLIFELQTYDRGYTSVRIDGITYIIHQDVLENDLAVRLFIGKRVGAYKEDYIGGIQTIEMSVKNLLTWNELIDLGVVNDAPNLVISYKKLIDENGHCLIGNNSTGGVCLTIPDTTTNGEDIVDVSTDDSEEEWTKANYPAKYICEVVLPKRLTSIGLAGPAFPMLGRNVVQHQVSVKVPKTVTTIGKKSFYGSKLQNLNGSQYHTFTYDDELETIDESAFENCGELTVVKFGKNLKTVNARAFANCRKLQVHFKNAISEVAEDACLLVDDVEYTPRIIEGEEIPTVVERAPFQAKLWNGKVGYTPGFYKSPVVYPAPDVPTVIPPPGGGAACDREPLDLSGVINAVSQLSAATDAIAQPD